MNYLMTVIWIVLAWLATGALALCVAYVRDRIAGDYEEGDFDMAFITVIFGPILWVWMWQCWKEDRDADS
jgi:hypothetical protein